MQTEALGLQAPCAHARISPDMKAPLLLASLCCMTLASCSLMEQRLQSESGLYDVKLTRSYKVPVEGYWAWGKGDPYAGQAAVVFYVAPLDVTAVQEDHPELAPNMVRQMHDLMLQDLSESFAEANAANKTQWSLTEDPALADVRFDLAVVHLRLRRPVLHVVGKVLGYVAPTGVGDAVELIAKGDITLEGTIRNNRNGELLLAFKDANRAPLRIYHKNTYSQTGHVDANLKLWAEKLAMLCRECAHDRLGDKRLSEKIEERTVTDVIKVRAHDAL